MIKDTRTNQQLLGDISTICGCLKSVKELIVRFKEMEAALAAANASTAQPRPALTQDSIEEIAHRRCKRYIHIDTEAPYQFDGQTLMDFLRDVQRNAA